MATWPELLHEAERLGLTVARGAAGGVIDGRWVTLEMAALGRSGAVITAQAALDPPLDLGLEMHERVVASILAFDRLTGHPDLDGEFVVTGDEPDRVRALFDGPLSDELAALYRASFDLRVHDGGGSVFAQVGFSVPDEAWLERALHGAARIVTLMEEARARVPPARQLVEHAEPLRAVAAARGLAFAMTPLTVWGAVEGRALRLGAMRTGTRKHHLAARAELDVDLGINLAVRRQWLLDEVRTLLGGRTCWSAMRRSTRGS